MKEEMTTQSVIEANKKVMEQFIRFINTGDRTIGEPIISPDVIFYAPTSPEPLHGFDGNHSIFRYDNFIGCFSADKIKMSVRK